MAAESVSLNLSEALVLYQTQFLTSRNLAQRSRREYTDDISDLIEFLQDKCRIDRPDRIERVHLEGYLAELDCRGLAGSTRRRKVASIRSFFGFLQDRGVVPQSPALRLIPPVREYQPPRVLTEGEYTRLREAVRGEVRDRAVIELLLQTGMRLSEIARLAVNHIDLPPRISNEIESVGSVLILAKGRKSRTVTLNWKACVALAAYLKNRPNVVDRRLFITKFGRGISPRAIEYLVDKYLKAVGVPSASVHTLRHTFATQMVKKGAKLEVIRQALGHSDLKTTTIYVELARQVMDKELQQNAL
jgi:site-specific recombinase XerD